MSQGSNDDMQAPKILTKTLGEKFNDSTGKINSLYSYGHIYKVPERLRKQNEYAYVPHHIAIGPLHWKDEHLLKSMQDVKMDYTNNLFLRLTKGMADPDEKKDKSIQECVEKMKKYTVKAKKYDAEGEFTLVDMAKKYYAEELELNDDEMVEMMLVDGCFILELLYVYFHTNYCLLINGGKGGSKSNRRGCEQPRADPICNSILTASSVRDDLMLFENQIPFFVLEHLFELTVAKIPVDPTTGCPPKVSLECYVRSYFSKFLSIEGRQSSDTKPKTNDYYHILHLIHSSYIPGEEDEETVLGIELNSRMHCELTLSASDLHYAGVKFVPTTDLLGVKFINKGIGCGPCRTLAFRVPTIYIRNSTESFLRNVIALEQCSPGVPRYFTSYAKLMDMFINSEEDVRVLKKNRVIHNYLSTDKDVRDLFNKLCKEVVLEDFHFYKDCRVASRFNMRWQTRAVRYMTRLLVASPWSVLSSLIKPLISC